MLFAKLLSLNSLIFDFNACNFTEELMVQKDKINGQSREGSSRVEIFKQTSLVHCYTIECSYHSCKGLNVLFPQYNASKKMIEPENKYTDTFSKVYEGKVNFNSLL